MNFKLGRQNVNARWSQSCIRYYPGKFFNFHEMKFHLRNPSNSLSMLASSVPHTCADGRNWNRNPKKCFFLHIFCYSLLNSALFELKEINNASSPLSNGLLVKLSSEKSRKLFLFRHCYVLLREYKQYIFSSFYTL